MKAGKAANLPGPEMVLEMNSGEYDLMVVWKMKDGIEDMNWEVSPNDVKWYNSFLNVVGSKEKADEIDAEYQACIRSSKGELARKKW